MEADWAVEIGAGLARIHFPWSRFACESGSGGEFIDLLAASELSASVAGMPETQVNPALFRALLRLNGPGSPVFTSKCDCWTLKQADIDPYEFDATVTPETGQASYIDFVLRDPERFIEHFISFEWHEKWMIRITDCLRKTTLRSVHVDLVLRQAEVRGVKGFGITVYAMGCGPDSAFASASWGEAQGAAVEAICDPQYLQVTD